MNIGRKWRERLGEIIYIDRTTLCDIKMMLQRRISIKHQFKLEMRRIIDKESLQIGLTTPIEKCCVDGCYQQDDGNLIAIGSKGFCAGECCSWTSTSLICSKVATTVGHYGGLMRLGVSLFTDFRGEGGRSLLPKLKWCALLVTVFISSKKAKTVNCRYIGNRHSITD